MSIKPPTQPIRDASLAEFNQMVGRSRGVATDDVRVSGTNPAKVTCDDIIVRNTLLLYGRVAGRLVLQNNLLEPSLQFLGSGTDSGMEGRGENVINMMIGGNVTTSWTASGMAVPRIYGPAGIIDCGGSSLVNVGAIIVNPGSYELVSLPVQTIGAVSVASIDIPTLPSAGMSANFDCVIRIAYVSVGSGGSINGSRESRVRIYQSLAAPSPVVGPFFEEIISESAALLGCAISVASGANKATVMVTGVAGHTIRWQTSIRIVKIES